MNRDFNDADGGTHNWYNAQAITDQEIVQAEKTMASGVLYIHMMRRLLAGHGFSFIRLCDGENQIMRAGAAAHCLQSQAWRQRYGVDGMDPEVLRAGIRKAGNDCTWLGLPIIGLVYSPYNLYSLFPNRTYVEQWCLAHWWSINWIQALVNAAPAAVICSNPQAAANYIQNKYHTGPVTCIQLSSWQDHDRVYQEALASPAKLLLMSGGPSGKQLMVKLGKAGKAVIDAGERLVGGRF